MVHPFEVDFVCDRSTHECRSQCILVASFYFCVVSLCFALSDFFGKVWFARLYISFALQCFSFLERLLTLLLTFLVNGRMYGFCRSICFCRLGCVVLCRRLLDRFGRILFMFWSVNGARRCCCGCGYRGGREIDKVGIGESYRRACVRQLFGAIVPKEPP